MLPAHLRTVYDSLVQYASQGDQTAALAQARKHFIARTGDLFESDDAFERRICAFLEWYTLDAQEAGATLASRYGQQLPPSHDHRQALTAWQQADLSLFAVVKVRDDHVVLDDLLLSQRHTVLSEPILVGLGPKDILAARVVLFAGQSHLTDGVSYFPKAAAKVLLRIAKRYRKGQVPGVSRLDLVHRLIYLANRSDRYRHVDPQKIFAEGETQVLQPNTGLPIANQ